MLAIWPLTRLLCVSSKCKPQSLEFVIMPVAILFLFFLETEVNISGWEDGAGENLHWTGSDREPEDTVRYLLVDHKAAMPLKTPGFIVYLP